MIFRCKCVGCANEKGEEGSSGGVRAGHDGKHTEDHLKGSKFLESHGMQARPHSWTPGSRV